MIGGSGGGFHREASEGCETIEDFEFNCAMGG